MRNFLLQKFWVIKWVKTSAKFKLCNVFMFLRLYRGFSYTTLKSKVLAPSHAQGTIPHVAVKSQRSPYLTDFILSCDIHVIYISPKNLYSTLIHSFDFRFECGIVITNVTVYEIHNFYNRNFHTFIKAELYSQPIQVLTSRGSMLNSGSNWGIGISSNEMSNFGVEPAWKTSWKRFEWIIMIRHISI